MREFTIIYHDGMQVVAQENSEGISEFTDGPEIISALNKMGEQGWNAHIITHLDNPFLAKLVPASMIPVYPGPFAVVLVRVI